MATSHSTTICNWTFARLFKRIFLFSFWYFLEKLYFSFIICKFNFSYLKFYLFQSLKLSSLYSLVYSLMISILFYPVVGTPFVDTTQLFLIISFYIFIFVINSEKYLLFPIIPFLLCLSFLSKQTPAVYGVITITFLILLNCLLEKKRIRKY